MTEAFLADIEAAAVELGFTEATIEQIVRGYDQLADELRTADKLAGAIARGEVPKWNALFWRSRGRRRKGTPWREWAFDRWGSSTSAGAAPNDPPPLPVLDSESRAERLARRGSR